MKNTDTFSQKNDLALRLYHDMLRIRCIEEAIAEHHAEQEMRCPTHLSIGQEASAVGVCAALTLKDVVYSTHRCHAHYLAKGGSLKAMLAELYGKITGCAAGKGGSMHLIDTAVGMMGASAIVGGTLPVALGHAFAFHAKGEPLVAVAFFGDAAVEQGTFHESLNFAVLKCLPILFICENNGLATITPLSERQPDVAIYTKAQGHGMPGFLVDGNDVLSVYEAARQAVERARRGEGPTLIECRVSRWREHVGPGYDWDLGFRSQDDVKRAMAECPIRRIESVLKNEKILTTEAVALISSKIKNEIDEAFLFAKESPYPPAEDTLRGLFA